MFKNKIYYFLVMVPLKSACLGIIVGVLSYIFLGFVTDLSSSQRIIALVGWPLILCLFALLWGAKEYRRSREHERSNS